MGNACSSDENKATDGKANQEVVNNNPADHPGLRKPTRNNEYVSEAKTPNKEHELNAMNYDSDLHNSGKFSAEIHKDLPKIEELPEITNKEVNLT